jgi:hypothetical protein
MLSAHRSKEGSAILGIIVIVTLIFVITALFNYFWYNLEKAPAYHAVESWLLFVTGVGTAVLAFIAYDKFSGVQGNFLLQIDARWSAPDMVAAKIRLRTIFLESKIKNMSKCEAIAKMEAYEEVGKILWKMSTEIKRQEEFACIKNLLDFMETIGYFYKEGYVGAEALNELCGSAIIEIYKLFEKYITMKQKEQETKKGTYYVHFKELYEELERLQIEKK